MRHISRKHSNRSPLCKEILLGAKQEIQKGVLKVKELIECNIIVASAQTTDFSL